MLQAMISKQKLKNKKNNIQSGLVFLLKYEAIKKG